MDSTNENTNDTEKISVKKSKKKLLNLHSYPCSVWDITPRVRSLQTRKDCS